KTALDCLLEIRRIAATQHSPTDLDRFIHLLAIGDIASVLSFVRKSGVDPPVALVRTFVETMHGDTHWAGQAIGVIRSEDSQGKAAAFGEGMYLSSFAGVFLLGPSLLKVRLGEISEAVTRSCDEPAQAGAWFRQLVLLKCLGRERTRNAASDPAIRLLAGAENDFVVGAVQTKWNDFFDHDSGNVGDSNESVGLGLVRSML